MLFRPCVKKKIVSQKKGQTLNASLFSKQLPMMAFAAGQIPIPFFYDCSLSNDNSLAIPIF